MCVPCSFGHSHKMKGLRFACLSLLIAICVFVEAVPHGQSKDIVMVEEIVRLGSSSSSGDESESNKIANVTLITQRQDSSSSEENSKESADFSDDLIFLAHKNQSHTTAAQQVSHLDDSTSEEEEEPEMAASSTVAAQAPTVPPIDMSPFVALIPTRQVQAIVDNYYRNDREVQRACAYLKSEYFGEMKQQIIQLPEVLAFTRYLNASGLDILNLTQAVVQATKPNMQLTADELTEKTTTVSALELDVAKKEDNSTKEQLNGLHGLVDSVLDVLPQDQILATFFDKVEADQQFSKLIDSIGTPKFSKILSNLQSSIPLRNLIFELHNNGIYITRIVESLKSYFFLASF